MEAGSASSAVRSFLPHIGFVSAQLPGFCYFHLALAQLGQASWSSRLCCCAEHRWSGAVPRVRGRRSLLIAPMFLLLIMVLDMYQHVLQTRSTEQELREAAERHVHGLISGSAGTGLAAYHDVPARCGAAAAEDQPVPGEAWEQFYAAHLDVAAVDDV